MLDEDHTRDGATGEDLLRRARKALGATTETDTIHQALRAVLLGEQAIADLLAVRGRVRFRPTFEKEMRAESRRP